MSKKEQKSLEEITRSVRRGIKFPEFETLRDFETKALKIARKYDPDTKLHSAHHGNGVRVVINGRLITVSKRQRGNEDVISKGVFKEAITRMSDTTRIPYDQLELYFLGHGKSYRGYKRRFEDEYNL